MHRREFLELVWGGVVLSTRPRLLADTILLSSNPLVAEFNLQSLTGRYTPTEDFYVRNHFPIPALAGTGSLRIEGEVEKQASLLPQDLTSLRVRELGAVLECAGNGTGPEALASSGLWEGWAFEDVLALARPTAKATYLHLIGRDGFARSVPREAARSDAMLVTRLNHQSLTVEHGSPWRALFPGWYGMSSVKWLERIVLSESPLPPQSDEYLAKFSKVPPGHPNFGPLPRIQVKSVITYPALGVILHPGTVTLRGLAWSGSGKIAVVEVSADGGKTWRVAKLEPSSRYEWAQWQFPVRIPEPGVLNVACKAVDEKGSEQPIQRDPNRVDGYANNTIEQVHFLIE